MSEINLLPCPFCGGKAHIRCIMVFERPWFPECENERCIAGDTGVSFSTEEEAAEAWNKRVGDQNEQT